VSRFKRLTDAEARTLTRAELLDRVEAEQAYWSHKRTMTDADSAAERVRACSGIPKLGSIR
jgi:hypothetical protein